MARAAQIEAAARELLELIDRDAAANGANHAVIVLAEPEVARLPEAEKLLGVEE